ncbi:carbohydrate sulfotransferase 11-like isoform X2 [Arctopsyche grandis]|uniref:carbohydrate sulfotransferase 11-like isoform X2 n=1 Tax=Arctopsyche grandis TaxID=121162 RepID=UPI00406D81BC
MNSNLRVEEGKQATKPPAKKGQGTTGHKRLMLRAPVRVVTGSISRRGRKSCGAPKRCLALAAPLAALPILLLLATDPRRSSSLRHFTSQQYLVENGSYAYRRSGSHETATRRELSPSEMDGAESRMERRRDHLNKACRRLPSGINNPNAWEYLINKQYHLIWCNVFKAASSSWMYNFNLMANYSAKFLERSREVPLVLARRRYPRPSVDELKDAQNTSTTFIIVRHPFERLSSAYKDKLQFALPNSLHSRLGMKIILKYRPGAKRMSAEPRWPTFEEFVRYLLDEVRAGRDLDMHWVPYTTFCTPCQIHFDVIAKFETLQDDQNYLIQKVGLQDIIKPQWKNSGKGRNTATLLLTHYSQLTTKQIWGLYNLYQYDFQLFNYTINTFLEVAKDYNPKMFSAT